MANEDLPSIKPLQEVLFMLIALPPSNSPKHVKLILKPMQHTVNYKGKSFVVLGKLSHLRMIRQGGSVYCVVSKQTKIYWYRKKFTNHVRSLKTTKPFSLQNFCNLL